MRLSPLALLTLTFFLGGVSAFSTTFTDRSSFTANASNLTTITFENIAPDGDSTPEPAGLTISNLHFSAGGDSQLLVNGKGDSYLDTSVLSSTGGSAGDSLVVTLPAGITAVGL